MTITTIIVNFVWLLYYYKPLIGRLLIIWILQWLPAVPIWLYALSGYFVGFNWSLFGAFLVDKTKVLWRFHLIHHTDTWIDTTTANRHHPEKVLFGLRLPR
jgi:sterol desaturase/sphingolipid hydroxylase (fatty acid hydroxylase superfamily)